MEEGEVDNQEKEGKEEKKGEEKVKKV